MTPRDSRDRTVSASTAAPVASSVVTCDIRRIDDAHVADLGELEQGRVGPTEEQRALEPVGHDALVEQGALLDAVVVLVVDVRRARRRSASASSRSAVVFASWRRATAPAVTMPSTTAVDEVEARPSRGRSGRARTRRPRDSRARGPQARHLDHPHRGGDEHAGERGQRDPADDGRRAASTTTQQHDRRARPPPAASAAPRPDVDGGPRDRGRRRDAAEQRDGEVGQALAEQLAVGVVAARRRSSRRRRWPTAGSRARPGRPPRRPATTSTAQVAPG